MSQTLSRQARFALVVATALVAACGDRKRSSASSDSDLAKDLTLAAADTLAQPQLHDVAIGTAAPAPASTVRQPSAAQTTTVRTPTRPRNAGGTTREPVPTPDRTPAPANTPAPASRLGIMAGTQLSLHTSSKVCTTSNVVGDQLIATLDAPVTGVNGATLPAGTKIVLQIASMSHDGKSTAIVFRPRSADTGPQSYPVSGTVETEGTYETVRNQGGSDRRKVIGGAIAGAILGQMAGKDTKATVIGAAAGGAAGAVMAARSATVESCLPANAPLRLTLVDAIAM